MALSVAQHPRGGRRRSSGSARWTASIASPTGAGRASPPDFAAPATPGSRPCSRSRPATGTALWVATPRGLARYERGRWTVFHGRSPVGSGSRACRLAGKQRARPAGDGAPRRRLGDLGGHGRRGGAVPGRGPGRRSRSPACPIRRSSRCGPRSGPTAAAGSGSAPSAGVARLRLDGAGRALGGSAPEPARRSPRRPFPPSPRPLRQPDPDRPPGGGSTCSPTGG